jgi:hypothetical protein
MTCPGHTRPCFIGSTVHFISDALRRSARATATGNKSAGNDQGEGDEEVFHGWAYTIKIHPSIKFHHSAPNWKLGGGTNGSELRSVWDRFPRRFPS